MNIASVSSYSTANHVKQALAYGFGANISPQDGEIEPIQKIARDDMFDIDFNKVKEYEARLFKDGSESSEVKDEVEEAEVGEQSSKGKTELTEKEEKIIKKLQARDVEVKTHEQAHMVAGGGLVRGGASYSYTVGSDGKQYATGGEVNIDMSAEEDPQKTIAKMQQVVTAAMAPAEPSGQDYAVAAAAKNNEMEARKQLAEEKSSSATATSNSNNSQIQTKTTDSTARLNYNNYKKTSEKSVNMLQERLSKAYNSNNYVSSVSHFVA